MTIISDAQFADFLTTFPLYNKLKVVENLENGVNNYSHFLDFENKVFKFKCPSENEIETFRTKLPGHAGLYGRRMYNENEMDELPMFFDKDTLKLDLVIHLKAVCQSCHKTIDFLIKATSDKNWEQRKSGLNIYIQKIGQFPGYEIEPDISVQKYLTEEDISNYKKALTNLSVSFGIGSYAYFRRIIENEIKRIIKDISELDFEGSDNVKQAYKTFESDRQMGKLIDVVTKYLPVSLNELGDNPIRLLYEQLSGGIHQFSEHECIEKAKLIDIVLKYVIRKVHEEKYQIKEVKDALMKLRSNGS
jgi:hypothetical protein